MGAYIIRRLIWMVLVLFFVSIITFGLMHVVPGGPFDREKKLSPTILANINAKYHLNDPLPVQYLTYMGNILLPRIYSGGATASQQNDYLVSIPISSDKTLQWINFGPSFTSSSRSVNDIFRDNLPVSAQLGILGMIIALAIGLPMGILAALNHNKSIDYLATTLAVTGVSFPAIALGPILITVFALSLNWLPVSGWDTPATFILPAFTLGFGASALIARLTRASLLEVLNEDYIRTAKAKGLSNSTVVIIHAMKNGMIPVLTILGPLFATLLTGTFVVETIFAIPGMGSYFVTSITNRDYPVIMGTALLYAGLLVLANLVVDISYGWLDPRIRYN
jgi:ABC-type dipeptide/oligopeptide/nickel transport system permease component